MQLFVVDRYARYLHKHFLGRIGYHLIKNIYVRPLKICY